MINVNLLPKSLRRVREPGYWRVLAVAFPLVVASIAGGVQYLSGLTISNLEREAQLRRDQLALLQPFLAEQRQLQGRQQALRQLIAIAEEVRRGRVEWTGEIGALLEYLPRVSTAGAPSIDFKSLTMRSVFPYTAQAGRFEGASIGAEFAVSGTVADAEVLAQFVRNLEQARDFGVAFQSASRVDPDDEYFTYSVVVGSLRGTR